MLPTLDQSGNLPPGIHEATWQEFEAQFGASSWRRLILERMREALQALHVAGCCRAYIDGSFVTQKDVPGDFDACWETGGVDLSKLDPVLLDFSDERWRQKSKYLGELFPASSHADAQQSTFLEFFQRDKETDAPKGIVLIDLKKMFK